MAILYSDQFNTSATTATSSGALSATTVADDKTPQPGFIGEVVQFRAVFATAIPVTGDKLRICKVRKGARLGLLSFTTSADMDSGTGSDAKIGWETTDDDAFGASFAGFESATTTTIAQSVLNAAVATGVEEYLTVTMLGDCTTTGILTVVGEIIYPS